MHATEFLKESAEQKTYPVYVLYGTERSLKHKSVNAISQELLGEGDEPTRFAGKSAELSAVRDELLTISMWSSQRLVIVEDADEFITANRAGLEKYLDSPAKKSVLILDVQKWAKNTRMAKKLPKVGLLLECVELKGGLLTRWIQNTARDDYSKQISRDAAALMPQLAGNGLGLLEQELSKLSAYVGERPSIDVEDVRKLVGGWRAETTWEMLNSLRDERLEVALTCLDKLLNAGEAPQRILGGIVYVYRKLALAAEKCRQGQQLNAALKEAGVFFRDIPAYDKYLRRIGRPQAERILTWLQEADRNLKGGSRLPERIQMERLLVELSGKMA